MRLISLTFVFLLACDRPSILQTVPRQFTLHEEQTVWCKDFAVQACGVRLWGCTNDIKYYCEQDVAEIPPP